MSQLDSFEALDFSNIDLGADTVDPNFPFTGPEVEPGLNPDRIVDQLWSSMVLGNPDSASEPSSDGATSPLSFVRNDTLQTNAPQSDASEELKKESGSAYLGDGTLGHVSGGSDIANTLPTTPSLWHIIPQGPPFSGAESVFGSGRLKDLNFPSSLCAVDAHRALVCDTNNHRLLLFTWGAGDSIHTRVVGTATTWLRPCGVCLIPVGRGSLSPLPSGQELTPGDVALLVCDTGHHRLKLLVLHQDGTESVCTIAGSGVRGCRDGTPRHATFDAPCSLCIAPDGSLLLADSGSRTSRCL